MRVYVPATMPLLAGWYEARELGPTPLRAHAVTGALREWYASGDAEELEYAATRRAARDALALLDPEAGGGARRVVVAVDVPDTAVTPTGDSDPSLVLVNASPGWDRVAALLVDDPAAAALVARAASAYVAALAGDPVAQAEVDDADGEELAWYGVQEVGDLLAGEAQP